eukprot:COSAG05_NODE_84_length_20716_cov_100.586312_10_plen_171_part_01
MYAHSTVSIIGMIVIVAAHFFCSFLILSSTSSARYLSWVNMMLLVHEGSKQGKITQVILLPDIESATARKQELTVVCKNGTSKWEMPTVYDADVWESYIAQFLMEREEEVERVRFGECASSSFSCAALLFLSPSLPVFLIPLLDREEWPFLCALTTHTCRGGNSRREERGN